MKDSHLTLTRFDGYVADEREGPDGFAGTRTAYLDTIRYNFVPEANARIAALPTGEADFAASLAPDLVKRPEGYQIGSASGRERVCPVVELSVVAVSLKKQQ